MMSNIQRPWTPSQRFIGDSKRHAARHTHSSTRESPGNTWEKKETKKRRTWPRKGELTCSEWTLTADCLMSSFWLAVPAKNKTVSENSASEKKKKKKKKKKKEGKK